MSMLTKLSTRIGNAVKALSSGQLVYPGQSMIWFDLDAPPVDEMQREVGDGTTYDVLMTPIRWIQRSIVEAPFQALDEDGEPLDDSQHLDLLEQPNEWYSSETLLAATAFSLALDGNAYWLVVRNGNDDIAELIYAPHTIIEPKWPDDGAEFISHYEYKPQGRHVDLDPEDVIHFREGVDPSNMRKGLSPVKGLLRTIWSDKEASTFVATMLRNNGIPGVVVSPKGKDERIDKDQAEAIQGKLETRYVRAGRGRPMVISGPVDVHQFGFNPKDLDLSALRDVSEERVCAALGVQAAVVGFGSGMQQTKVGATMRELRQISWLNGVVPMQRIIAAELTRSLAPAFDDADSVAFDVNQVEALRENKDAVVARAERLYRTGIVTRAEARAMQGLESVPADDVYSLPMSMTLVPQGQEPAPVAPSNGDGNGAGDVEQRQRIAEYIKQGEHSLLEREIIDRAPRVTAPRRVIAFVRQLDEIRSEAPRRFASDLVQVFELLGREAAAAARRVLESRGIEQVSAGPHEAKQDDVDHALVDAIMAEIDTAGAQQALQEAFEANFMQVSQETFGAMETSLGIDISFPEQAQLNVLQEGGTRAGLIDLDRQTRSALFEALEQGRAEGLAGDNLARRIREHIEAGPWSDVETRARVIARTEGAHAANTATIESARRMEGAEMMMVHDNRTGFDDDVCSGIDGRVVTIQEARALGLAHPNCSRSFTVIPPLLAEEMGLT